MNLYCKELWILISQTAKSRSDRIQNVLSAFKKNNSEDLSQKRVLLIDDVLTTGATLEGCALALGPANISMVTVGIGT